MCGPRTLRNTHGAAVATPRAPPAAAGAVAPRAAGCSPEEKTQGAPAPAMPGVAPAEIAAVLAAAVAAVAAAAAGARRRPRRGDARGPVRTSRACRRAGDGLDGTTRKRRAVLGRRAFRISAKRGAAIRPGPIGRLTAAAAALITTMGRVASTAKARALPRAEERGGGAKSPKASTPRRAAEVPQDGGAAQERRPPQGEDRQKVQASGRRHPRRAARREAPWEDHRGP